MIIDAHHHFWDPRRADYPWMTDDLAEIRRPFGPKDLEPSLTGTGVDGTILVQTRASMDETREFLGTTIAAPFVRGVVGWVDLTDPAVADQIAELRSSPGGGRLVGIRHQVHDEADPEWLLRANVANGLRAVEAAGLVYDLLLRTRELPAALRVARSFPGLRFVIDHLAKPEIRDGVLQPWADRLAPFGDLQNVWCKVSGLVTEADWRTWAADDFRPFVRHAVEVFGPERLLFGSDWPVCLVAASYEGVHELATDLLGGLSPSERAGVFGPNATTVYRLGEAA
jgi:L-fuconolactonase